MLKQVIKGKRICPNCGCIEQNEYGDCINCGFDFYIPEVCVY